MIPVLEGFNHKAVLKLASVQLICGFLIIALNISQCAIGSSYAYYGYGIWTGIVFIVAGILGIISWKYKNTCNIIGLMVMSIIASVFGGVLLIISSVLISSNVYLQNRWDKYNKCLVLKANDDPFYPIQREDCNWYHDTKCSDALTCADAVPLEAILVITPVLEMIVSIVTSVYCCKAACCVARSTNQPQVVHTVHLSTDQAGPQVVNGTCAQQDYAKYSNQQFVVYMSVPPQHPAQDGSETLLCQNKL